MANERVSNERLAEMVSWCEQRKKDKPWYGQGDESPKMLTTCDFMISVVTELQALRSPHQGEVEAVAWRCEDLILPSVSIIDDWEHAQMRISQPKAWKVTPLYSQPSVPKAGEMDAEALERENKALREALKPFASGWIDASHTAVIANPDARKALDAARAALVQP